MSQQDKQLSHASHQKDANTSRKIISVTQFSMIATFTGPKANKILFQCPSNLQFLSKTLRTADKATSGLGPHL